MQKRPPATLDKTRELASAYMQRVQATAHGALAGAVSQDSRTCTTLSVKLHALTVLASDYDTSDTSEGGAYMQHRWQFGCSHWGAFVESGTPDADADEYTASVAGMRLVVGEGVALQGCKGESAFWLTRTGTRSG